MPLLSWFRRDADLTGRRLLEPITGLFHRKEGARCS